MVVFTLKQTAEREGREIGSDYLLNRTVIHLFLPVILAWPHAVLSVFLLCWMPFLLLLLFFFPSKVRWSVSPPQRWNLWSEKINTWVERAHESEACRPSDPSNCFRAHWFCCLVLACHKSPKLETQRKTDTSSSHTFSFPTEGPFHLSSATMASKVFWSG